MGAIYSGRSLEDVPADDLMGGDDHFLQAGEDSTESGDVVRNALPFRVIYILPEDLLAEMDHSQLRERLEHISEDRRSNWHWRKGAQPNFERWSAAPGNPFDDIA